jgi:hypothetical protein
MEILFLKSELSWGRSTGIGAILSYIYLPLEPFSLQSLPDQLFLSPYILSHPQRFLIHFSM